MTRQVGYHHGEPHGAHPLTITGAPAGFGPWGIAGQAWTRGRSPTMNSLACLASSARALDTLHSGGAGGAPKATTARPVLRCRLRPYQVQARLPPRAITRW